MTTSHSSVTVTNGGLVIMCDGQPYQYSMTYDQRVRMAHKLLGFAVVEMSNESARLELMSGVAAGAGDDVVQRQKEVE